jgi:ferredoxin
MKRIYVIEELCNGCRLCQSMCSSLENGIFSENARITILKTPGEEQDIPIIECDGRCILSTNVNQEPPCCLICPTGAIFYANGREAVSKRLLWEKARTSHGLFKIISPWKWPFPWNISKPHSNQDHGAIP